MKDLRTIQATRITKVREAARKTAIASCRVDPYTIDWQDPDFSVNKLREAISRRMREASAESSFGQLLRAGVQQFMFDAYQTVPTIFQDLVRVTSSNKYEELYSTLHPPVPGLDSDQRKAGNSSCHARPARRGAGLEKDRRDGAMCRSALGPS